jgi:Domain of unknown function (DUF4157)
MHQRTHKSSSWNPPIQQKSSQFAPRPNIQAQQDSHKPPTQEEIENEAFEQKREKGSRFDHNFVNIPLHSPDREVSAPIQPLRGALRPQSWQQSSEPAINGGMGWIQRAFPVTSAAPSHPMPPFQAKLNIGQPWDKYEQEADRVAFQVVKQIGAPGSAKATLGRSLQRQSEPEDEDLQAKSILQRREAIAGGEASTDLTSAINSARGGGQPLEAGLQQSMGQAMGADFSGVKVHTDAQSDQLNQSIQAKAFTTGQDVFFRQGAYQPGSRGGQELIAHELTHVVQQNGGAVMRSPKPKALETTLVETSEHESNCVAAPVDQQVNAPKARPVAQSRLVRPLAHPNVNHGIQRYFVNASQRYANTAVGAHGNVKFSAQQKNLVAKPSTPADPGPHPAVSTFVKADDTTKIVASQRIPLRISDEGGMAIEDSDLGNRQPKTFFAEPNLVAGSNNALKAVGSSYLLKIIAGQSIQIQDIHGNNHDLAKVRPIKLDAQGNAPVGAWRHPNADVNCSDVAAKIIGIVENRATEQLNPGTTMHPPRTVPTGGVIDNTDIETRIAYYINQYVTSRIGGANHAAAIQTADTATAGMAQSTGLLPHTPTVNTIARDYGTYLMNNPPELTQAVQDLGVNQFANPEVGQTYVTASLGRPTGGAIGPIPDWSDPVNPGQMKASGNVGDIWISHYGAVVAKDHNDTMTLQNYDRTVEDQGSGVGGRRTDNRYYFQMYGPATQIDPNTHRDQSWHTTWQHATRGFANPVTLALSAEEQYPVNAKTVAVLNSGVVLGIFNAQEQASIARFLRIKVPPAEQNQLVNTYRGKFNALQQTLTPGVNKAIIDLRLQAGKAAVLKYHWDKAGKNLVGALQLKANLLVAGIATPNPLPNLNPLLQNSGVPAATVTGALGL